MPPTDPTLDLRLAAPPDGDSLPSSVARIDPQSLERLGLKERDVAEIRGRRATVCRVTEGLPGAPTVLLGAEGRENVGAAPGAMVQVRRVEPAPADWIVLTPARRLRGERDQADLQKALQGRPLLVGELLRLRLESRDAELLVESTAPDGPVVVHAATQLMVGEPQPQRAGPRISYADVGGLGPQLRRVREMIELPLRFPELFERLGIQPPKGVLLHGPPGCGKTLIARAVAHMVDASFFSISGPEIIRKFYGESEAHLRTLFEEAAQAAPSILFLDELDAIAPSRDKVAGEVEKRVVAQLLTVMDGLGRREQVMVLAATNRPGAIDSALRRPGRFDREIAILPPDRFGRAEILRIHSRRMPLAEDVDLQQIGEITHGFVGADLEALCREAAVERLRRLLPDLDLDRDLDFDDGALDGLEITMEDFLFALRDVQPSALREVLVEMPDVRWSDVGGLEEAIERLRAAFEWPLRHRELFAAASVRGAKGILLHGPPGCGKTLLARAMAAESGVSFLAVKGPELLSMHVGESEEKVRDLFRKARQASPSILMLDEIDAFLPAREGAASSSGHTAERVLSQFLAELDGLEELRDVVVVGATNRPDLLDPALLRPGRFDEQIAIPLPDLAARRAIFEVHLRGKPFREPPDPAALAECADGLSGADIAEVVRRAALLAIARTIAAAPPGEAPDAASLRIPPEDLETALAAMRAARRPGPA